MDNIDYTKDQDLRNIKGEGDPFQKLLEFYKKENKEIVYNVGYNLNKGNKFFLKHYYSLIFLMENQFENYSQFQKSLLIELFELKAINEIIQNVSNIDEIKKSIKKFLSTQENFLNKSFDMCSSITDIKEKQKNYIESISYLKESFDTPKIINTTNDFSTENIESGVEYEK